MTDNYHTTAKMYIKQRGHMTKWMEWLNQQAFIISQSHKSYTSTYSPHLRQSWRSTPTAVKSCWTFGRYSMRTETCQQQRVATPQDAPHIYICAYTAD